MAEVLGAISAGTGIATFLVQVGKGIKTVRRAISYNRRQASVDLQSLEADLESLHKVIEELQSSQNNALVTLAIAKCQQTYAEIEPDLDRLTQVFGYDHSQSRLTSLKKRLTFKAEENVGKMRSKVSHMVDSLILISIFVNQAEHMQPRQTCPVSPTIADISSATDPTPTPSAQVAGLPALGNGMVTVRKRANTRIGDKCPHSQTSYTHGRFWWLELTSIPGFWHSCSTQCSTRCEWNAKLRLALTWLNIPFAVTASFGFTCRNGQYELKPALSIQHVVRNTSPGFEALYLCRISKLSVEGSKQRLRDLYRSDVYFKHHVNPEGNSYLRHLVSSPWPGQRSQFELLEFFVAELGMDFSPEDPRFLIDCSKWIGEGDHLHLLEAVLEHGFAPSAIDPPAANQWPRPHDPNWTIESRATDPFFVNYFATIVGYEPGFAGVTELQERILTNTNDTTLDSELSKHKGLLSTVNFLGQTSLHLAVSNLRTVTKLVELGHDLDVTDMWGTTPLMYAAAMGFQDVVVHLLQMGANPRLGEDRCNRTFLDYAIIRGHWTLIHKVLSTAQDLYTREIYQWLVGHVVVQSMTSNPIDVTEAIRQEHIPLVIQLCDNVNFSINDFYRCVTDNNLMHYAETVDEAQALVSRGFNLFNKPNSMGRLPIHTPMLDTALIRFCIEHGTNIDHVDANGHTLLMVLLSRLGSFETYLARDKLRQIRCCLELGADMNHSDYCQCPCSPGGCSSSAFFATGFERLWSALRGTVSEIFWIFEWQSILRDLCGDEAVREFLLSFIRRIKFDELDMTHVCCHGGSGIPRECESGLLRPYPKLIPSEDISDILTEEDDFIIILDQTMSELASKPVKELQRCFLEILKGKHDQHLQRNAEERTKNSQRNKEREKSRSWEVDYKNDEFTQMICVSTDRSDYSVPRSLATYIVCLDPHHSAIHGHVSVGSGKDAWFSSRMCLVKEVTEVFALSSADVIEEIEHAITFARLDLGLDDGKRIKDQLVNYFHADNL